MKIFGPSKKNKSSDERPRDESDDLQDRLGLILLYDGSHRERNGIDIIAVHGLRGHPTKSFTESSGKFCWLQDFLPGAIPGCRVFSYGYESTELPRHSTIATLSRNFLYDLRSRLDEKESTRSLVFIGHNLGGLLIKSLLVQATLDPSERFRTIVASTAGILFFGTPHHGSSAANIASTLTRLVRTTGVTLPTSLIHQMKTNSDFLQELGRDFVYRVVSQNMRIFSFYETRPTVSTMIVDRSSATLGLPNEVLIALNSDHLNLCKFQSIDEPQYRIVKNVLEELSSAERYHETRELPPTSTTDTDSQSDWVPNVVCKRGKTTKGLIDMAGSMDEPRNFEDAELDIVAVHGLGGSSYKSWYNHSARTLWLRDFLQRDFPNARIMSYGYKADAALNNGTLDISVLASDMLDNIIEARSENEKGEPRPLILIGYSFGGLLIKKALLLLRDGYGASAVYRPDILQSLAHIIFLGVPHEDSGINSRWPEIIQCTANIKAFDSFNVSASREQINETTREFRHFKDLDSASIAESEPTRIPKSNKKALLVSATSVQLEWGDRETVFVSRNQNHLELPTFFDAEDPTYVFIRTTVAKALSSLGTMSEEKEACLRLLQRAELSSSSVFNGIPITMDGLCDWIFDTTEMTSWLKNPDKSLLIRGPPGCGKSVLAKYLISELPSVLAPKATRVLYHLWNRPYGNHKPESVVASLLYQLCRERPSSFIRHAISAFRSMGDEFASSPEVLISIFLTIIREYMTGHIIIVLDGVDVNLPDILKLTHRLRQSGSVRFILTTRLNRVGAEEDVISIDWDSSFPISNIGIFVEKQLEKIKVDDSRKELIAKKMLEQGSSTFLWAVLVLQHLEETLPSSETIQMAGLSPSSKLKELYDTNFQQLKSKSSGKDWTLFCEVVKLMVVSQRPLALGAYVDALNIRPERIYGPYEIFKISQVQQIFSRPGFAALFLQDSSGFLRFVHLSLKDYLISPE